MRTVKLRVRGDTLEFAALRSLPVAAINLLLFAYAYPASGQEYAQDELRALPRACLAQKFINGSLRTPIVPEFERAQWEARLGSDYQHYHHFCWALMDLRRANTGPSQHRNFNYSTAVQNFEYVQRNASRAFPLLPEVYLRKGMALRYLGEEARAAREFLEAIDLKRDYTPAYSELIDLYLDLEDYESARRTLELGLAAVPDSKILASKKAEIANRSGSPSKRD